MLATPLIKKIGAKNAGLEQDKVPKCGTILGHAVGKSKRKGQGLEWFSRQILQNQLANANCMFEYMYGALFVSN